VPRRRVRRVSVIEQIRRAHPEADVDALLAEQRVCVDGVIMTNPRSLVPTDAAVRLLPARRLRGTTKLEAALRRFDLVVDGRVAVDVGAAAGGFTTALLEAGARRVYAVDVGHGQLVGRLRQDLRVVDLEGTNLASLDTTVVPEGVDLLTGDLSYLPASSAVGQLERLAFASDADLVWLVKPTFELRLGVPTSDPGALSRAAAVATAAIVAGPWRVVASVESPVRGRRGTVEVFIHARRTG
jgi:23S rRNA (cytidine1920-2'-O)/16S rRNA (cytidine1409-2'-O)-methyltransferase